MADATVATARRNEVLAPAAEEPRETVAAAIPAVCRPLAFLWAAMVLATVAFLLLGSLRVGAGNWIGRRMPVREIWARFLGYLADQGASAALVMAVIAAAGVALAAAAIAAWLAFGLKDARPEPAADDSAGM